jgi:eukaryotic-like serine/threonine-protein kinase
MSENESDLAGEQYELLLAACDEALATGETPGALSQGATPAELQPGMERDLACIKLLRRWRVRESPIAAAPLAGASPIRLGRFEIRRELGRGGFAIVFAAHDPQLHREVALKVPRADVLVTPELRARFQQEARAAAGLDHPNIVPVYEAGELGPICYIAEAYCPGSTLAQWLREQTEPVPEKVAAQLLTTLADAAHHAHGRGVLHRDLKPSNILLQESRVRSQESAKNNQLPADPCPLSPDPWVPKITDFGLAKLIGPEAQVLAAEHQTISGAFVGTPSYMAPEQASGRSKEITTAVDIYSLGAILYELLTRRPPFQAETALETLEQVRSQEPVPPRRFRTKLTRDLETICLKCLQKEPGRRYASAHALGEDLRRFLADEPIQARPTTAWERAVKWTKRRPAVAALLVLLGLTTALGFGLVTWKWQVAETALQDTELARKNEREERQRAEANLYAKLVALARTEWSAGNLDMAKQYLDECDPELRDEAWQALHRVCHAEVATLRGISIGLWGLAYSPDGRRLAGADGSTIRVWECSSWRELTSFPDLPTPMSNLTYSSDGNRLVYIRSIILSPGYTPSIQTLDLQKQKQPREFPLSREMALNALSPDGSCVLVSFIDRTLKILRVADGKELVTFGPLAAFPQKATFSSDGKEIAVLQDNQVMSIWDTTTGVRTSEFPSPDTAPGLPAFHAVDGRLAVMCSDTRSQVRGRNERRPAIKVIDVRSGKELATCAGHTASIQWLAFSPDGRRLASASSDHTVRIWDAATGAELATLRGHADAVMRLAFNPDGRHLASSSSDRTVKIWDTSPFVLENTAGGWK